MKALKALPGGALSWSEAPDPVIKENEVLVRTEYAGVNRADLMQRAGTYPPPPGWPDWLGLELSGTVEKAGSAVKRWKPGDRVCGLLGGGACAEYAAVPQDMLMPVPKGVTMAQAAGIPETYATGYLNLFIEASLKAGETLLVTGGNSGLASAVIPMAKAFGIRVVTTVRGAKKAVAVAGLGADLVVDTTVTPLPDALRAEAEAGRPVNAALDCVGGSDVGRSLPHLAFGARWIVIAALAGNITEIDLRTVYVKNIRIIGSTLRARTNEMKASVLAALEQKIFPLMEKGSLVPNIYAEVPVSEAGYAHSLLENGVRTGKVVLKIR